MSAVAIAFVVTPFVGLVTAMAFHVALSRRASWLHRPQAVAFSVMAGLVPVGALAWLYAGSVTAENGEGLGSTAAWLLAYLGLAYFYVFGFYNMGESARRLRLLIELYEAGPRGLTLEELLRAYNAQIMVDNRLQRLLSGGQIAERDGRYTIRARRVLLVPRILTLLKVVFLGAPSEFGHRPPPAARPR